MRRIFQRHIWSAKTKEVLKSNLGETNGQTLESFPFGVKRRKRESKLSSPFQIIFFSFNMPLYNVQTNKKSVPPINLNSEIPNMTLGLTTLTTNI